MTATAAPSSRRFNMAHTYNLETGAWIQDVKDGWIASKVFDKSIDGDKVKLVFEITSGEREGEVCAIIPNGT